MAKAKTVTAKPEDPAVTPAAVTPEPAKAPKESNDPLSKWRVEHPNGLVIYNFNH